MGGDQRTGRQPIRQSPRKPSRMGTEDKMIRNDTASYARFWKSEPKSAAYLGYKDIGVFRMFRFHHVVLKWFLVFYENLQKANVKVPLSLLKDISDTNKYFPNNIPTLLTKYPTGDDLDKETVEMNKNYLYASVLMHLTRPQMHLQALREFTNDFMTTCLSSFFTQLISSVHKALRQQKWQTNHPLVQNIFFTIDGVLSGSF